MGLFSKSDPAEVLEREQDRQLRRARAAGFGGTADKALERAGEIGRQADALRDAGAGAWRNRAHP